MGIARAHGLSAKSVENHRGHILEKPGGANAAALALAFRDGLLDHLAA